MARLTKIQINYLEEKIERKIAQLMAKIDKESGYQEALDKLNELFDFDNFITWVTGKKTSIKDVKDYIKYSSRSKSDRFIIPCLRSDYYPGRNRINVQRTLGEIKSSKCLMIRIWGAASGAIDLLKKCESIEKATEQSRIDLEKKRMELMDSAVFSGMSDDIMKQINDFLKS